LPTEIYTRDWTCDHRATDKDSNTAILLCVSKKFILLVFTTTKSDVEQF